MDVKLDDAALNKVLSTIIFELLSDESKKSMLTEAVAQFLDRRTYDGKSRVRELFENQLNKACERICIDMISKDERLLAMVTEVYNEVVGKLREQMVLSLTDHILKKFKW